MSTLSARERHITGKALAVALDIINRAHSTHQPSSDADDMADLFLRLCPDQLDREVHQHAVRWLLCGGLDMRKRPFDSLALNAAPPSPQPGGGERVAA